MQVYSEVDEAIKALYGREDQVAAAALSVARIRNRKKDFNELKQSYASYDDEKAKTTEELDGLKAKLKEYETASAKRKIADEIGLDKKALEFISGETEEEMKASAEKLKALTGITPPPLASNEKTSVNSVDAAFMELNDKLKGN